MSQAIEDDKVVLIHYILRDDDGQVLDQSAPNQPLAYLHGHSNIVPGLEAALAGHTTGDAIDVAVPPDQGYGERQGPGPQAVPRKELGPEADNLRAGMPLRMRGQNGEIIVLWVTEAKGARVWLDINHPLAGQTLHFSVTVGDIRDATAEEVAHGHAHGPGGHH